MGFLSPSKPRAVPPPKPLAPRRNIATTGGIIRDPNKKKRSLAAAALDDQNRQLIV